MTIPSYARLAAKLMQPEHERLPATAAPADERTEAIAGIERALIRRARGQRLRRVAYASLGVAAAAGVVFWLALPSTEEAPRAAVASHAPAPPTRPDVIVHTFDARAGVVGSSPHGTSLDAGGRVQAPDDGHALLAFATGTRVTLEGGGDLTMVANDATQALALDRGALRADVAKLAPGHRFLVHTSDAEIEVHGTSFRVIAGATRAQCGPATSTRVEVFEGVVTVRHDGIEHHVRKGEQWPPPCPDANDVALAPAQESAVTPAPARQAGARSHEDAPAAPAIASASTLVEQNDAFAAAVAAHRAGDLARAVRGFDALLARFPNGPLTESAAVQRMKVMRALDGGRARDLARAYLARYPHGFAREQAAALLAEAP